MAGTTPVVMIWSRIGWSARGCAGFRLRHHLTSHRLDQRLIQRGEKRPFGHGQDDLRRRNRRWPNDFANVVLVERTDRRGRLVVSQGRSLMGVETGTQLESISNCVPVSSPRGRAYDGLHVSVRTGDEVPAPPAEVGGAGHASPFPIAAVPRLARDELGLEAIQIPGRRGRSVRHGEIRCPAAHNAVGLAGESPAVGIDCLST